MNYNKYEPYKDQFNIYNLITKIDRNYRLIFNKVNKLFYIINIAKNNQICLKFKSFDTNIINLLQKSRVENSKKIFNYIENYNNSLTNKIINNHIQSTTDKLKELSKFYNRTNTISINTTKKIIEDNYAKNNFN